MRNYIFKQLLQVVVFFFAVSLAMPVIASDLGFSYGIDVGNWENLEDDEQDNVIELAMGVRAQAQIEVDNTSKFGGGPLDSPNTLVSLSSGLTGGVNDSIFAEEGAYISDTNIGEVKAGSFSSVSYDFYANQRGRLQLSLAVKGDLFDPDPDNNAAILPFNVTGPEVSVQDDTNNQQHLFGTPLTFKASNDLNPVFLTEGQLLEYWFIIFTGSAFYSWGFGGLQAGLIPVGVFSLAHFENMVVLQDIVLPVGDYIVGFCLDKDLNNVLDQDKASCDALKLNIKPTL